MDVNLYGMIRTVRTFLPLLKQCPNSRVINLTSVAAFPNMATSYNPSYCASKSAANAFTTSLSIELGPLGIKVTNMI